MIFRSRRGAEDAEGLAQTSPRPLRLCANKSFLTRRRGDAEKAFLQASDYGISDFGKSHGINMLAFRAEGEIRNLYEVSAA